MTLSCAERPSVILISDMAGYGKVALSVMIPVLSYLKMSSLGQSVRFAMGVVSQLLERCFDAADCLKGIPVEVYLGEILAEGVVEQHG